MHPNAQLLIDFYTAFQRLDAKFMASAYAAEARFSDPVFPMLQGAEAGDMWRMLAARAQNFSLTFDGIDADERRGRAHWIATYTFSPTGRTVVNDIHADFEFQNGRIVRHTDRFDLWRWSRQALGIKGWLLGWTPMLRKAVQGQAAKGLAAFRKGR